MPNYYVDAEIASRIEMLVKKEPFEELTFNEALLRLLALIPQEKAEADKILEGILGSIPDKPKVKSSPRPHEWVMDVPELKGKKRFATWKSICDYLSIDVGSDSARRKLQAWVMTNRPNWPSVPDA